MGQLDPGWPATRPAPLAPADEARSGVARSIADSDLYPSQLGLGQANVDEDGPGLRATTFRARSSILLGTSNAATLSRTTPPDVTASGGRSSVRLMMAPRRGGRFTPRIAPPPNAAWTKTFRPTLPWGRHLRHGRAGPACRGRLRCNRAGLVLPRRDWDPSALGEGHAEAPEGVKHPVELVGTMSRS
jgi:hypothetical protein